MTLRTRLLLAVAVILGVVGLGGVVLVRAQRTYLTRQVDEQLDAARPLVRFPTDLPDDGPPPPVDQNAPVSSLYVARISDGELQVVLRGQLLDDEPAVPTDAEGLSEVADGEPFTVEGVNGETRFRVAVRQLPGSGAASVVALPLDEVDAAIARLRLALVLSTAAIAAVLAVALWWVERLGLRPVARVTAAADAIAHGDREHRVVDANPRTEAGRLANAFNVMLDERDASEGRLRQFVADASHELRTPLTSIRGYLDLYRQGGFREPSQLDDMIRRMRQESGRMNDLVEDLVLLTQLDQHRPLRSEDVDVGRLVRDAAVDAQVIQPERPVVVSVDDSADLGVIGDLYRLQQVIGALVTNALAYTDRTSELRLLARSSDEAVEFVVADRGPGLAAPDAARAFDRFYRGEASRARRTGGSGLGLAIAKSIVEAHGGTITLTTAPHAGCRFVVVLPRRRVGAPAGDGVSGPSRPLSSSLPPSAPSPTSSRAP